MSRSFRANRPLLLRVVSGLCFIGSCLLFGASQCLAQTLTLDQVTNNFSRPVYATHAPGDSDRLFVLEQRTGNIQILNLDDGSINANPFLNLTVAQGGEQGLLGLAFHPDFQNNNQFFVNYIDTSGDTRVQRYTATDSNTADASSAFDVLSIVQPQSNHNAGWIDFGPDNLLYIATGDGGGGNDNGTGHTLGLGNSQDTTNNLLGKILRVDVDSDGFANDATRNYSIPNNNPFVGTAGDDEIFAFGLRNPYRSSFDRLTGDLYIGDVGQNAIEEIDFIASGSGGGQNFGWRPREGTIATPGLEGDPLPVDAIDPVYQYLHGVDDDEGFSVTGGYVYRGPLSELDGHYFFSDFVTDRLWSFQFDGTLDPDSFDATNFTNFIDWTDDLTIINGTDDFANISSFAEDANGNLYAISLNGSVFRFEAASIPEPGSGAAILLLTCVTLSRRRRALSP